MDTIKQKTKIMMTISSPLSDLQKKELETVSAKYLDIAPKLNCYQDNLTNCIIIEYSDIQICETICRDLLPTFPDTQKVLTITLEKELNEASSVYLRKLIIPSGDNKKISEIYNISYIYTENSNDYLVQASGVDGNNFRLEVSDIIQDLDTTNTVYTSTLQVATSLLQSF